jgi:hypothetical protein
MLLAARHFVDPGNHPSDRTMRDMRNHRPRPGCLSPAFVHLLKDTLSKGCVLHLVRIGGWRNDRFLRDGSPLIGRIWERSPLEDRTLHFSRHVVEFLLWAAAERVHETNVEWDAPPSELTPADELFFWLAFDACRTDPDLAAALRKKAAFRLNRLCRLSFPGDIASTDAVDFDPCFTGLRAAILECLQPELAKRWIRSERAKGQIGDWTAMRDQGHAEFASLSTFLEAARPANRLDLARFVLNVNATIFRSELQPIFWTAGLQGSGPSRLADRLDTQRAALAMPRQMETLGAWEQEARGVGYFDDGYAASQFFKEQWEAAGGEQVAARAAAAVQAVEPLRTGN